MGSGTRAAQQELLAVDPALRVDGAWGRKTQAAFDRAPSELKAKIRSIFVSSGKIPPWEERSISRDEARLLVERAASATGIPQYAGALKEFLELEAAPSRDRSGYNVNSQNGGSRGLMQMQRAAWSDAQKVEPTLGGYDKVFDPYQNILAGAAYAKINARAIAKAGYPVTGKNLYLAHNQGAGYFSGSRTNVRGQSAKVQELIASGPERM